MNRLGFLLLVFFTLASCKKENATITFKYGHEMGCEVDPAKKGSKDTVVFQPLGGRNFNTFCMQSGANSTNLQSVVPLFVNFRAPDLGETERIGDNSVFGDMEVFIRAPGLPDRLIGSGSGPFGENAGLSVISSDVQEYLKTEQFTYKLIVSNSKDFDTSRIIVFSISHSGTTF